MKENHLANMVLGATMLATALGLVLGLDVFSAFLVGLPVRCLGNVLVGNVRLVLGPYGSRDEQGNRDNRQHCKHALKHWCTPYGCLKSLTFQFLASESAARPLGSNLRSRTDA